MKILLVNDRDVGILAAIDLQAPDFEGRVRRHFGGLSAFEDAPNRPVREIIDEIWFSEEIDLI